MDPSHKPLFTLFESPGIFKGSRDFALARSGNTNPNHYLVVHSMGSGFFYSREERRYSILNLSTGRGAAEVPRLSENGRPLIWFDAEIDRPGSVYGPNHDMLSVLQAASIPLLRVTGRTRTKSENGVEREEKEVEILLGEDELARICCYCGIIEYKTDTERFEKCSGEGYQSLYWCEQCAKDSPRRWRLSIRNWLGMRPGITGWVIQFSSW